MKSDMDTPVPLQACDQARDCGSDPGCSDASTSPTSETEDRSRSSEEQQLQPEPPEHRISVLLDAHLGYAGESWSSAELRQRAAFLVASGRSPADVEELLLGQNERIASLQCGMSIRRVDGSSWRLVGNRGQLLDTVQDVVVVLSVDTNGEMARVQDSKIYGQTDLKEHLFVVV